MITELEEKEEKTGGSDLETELLHIKRLLLSLQARVDMQHTLISHTEQVVQKHVKNFSLYNAEISNSPLSEFASELALSVLVFRPVVLAFRFSVWVFLALVITFFIASAVVFLFPELSPMLYDFITSSYTHSYFDGVRQRNEVYYNFLLVVLNLVFFVIFVTSVFIFIYAPVRDRFLRLFKFKD